jgi:hypothetical protein
MCDVDDGATISQVADWRKGCPVLVTGTIYDTILGSLVLKECTVQ